MTCMPQPLPLSQQEEEPMCTPGNMPPMCSCPHEGAAVPRAFLAVAVLAGGVAWVIAAGYGLWLFLAGWLMLMGAAALVSQARDRRAREAAMTVIEGRVVTGSAATVPRSPARQTAGRREWQRER